MSLQCCETEIKKGTSWKNIKTVQKNDRMPIWHSLMAVLDVQAGFRKGGIRDQIANIRWIIEKVREFQKSIYLCFINYAKAFDYVDHNKLWRALKEMGIPGHLTRLLRNLYMGQEATVTTLYGTIDWFKIEKRVRQGCLLSPCLTYILSTSWKMLGWMSYKLESRYVKETSTTPDMLMIPL